MNIKLLTGVGFVVALLLLAGLVVFFNLASQKDVSPNDDFEPVRASLTGVYGCFAQGEVIVSPEAAPPDCQPLLVTDAGEYYAVDFYLMSQTHEPLMVGQGFSAEGVITPIERLSTDLWRGSAVQGVFSVTGGLSVEGEVVGDKSQDDVEVNDEPNVLPQEPVEDESVFCTADAMQCPDGSYVGRTGPKCEFAACPGVSEAAEVNVALGASATANGVTITAQEVVSDSRCPQGVQCVWEGTVAVKTTLATAVAHGEHVLKLGEPQLFGDVTVTLTKVAPIKTKSAIADADYLFTYTVTN